MGKKYTTRHATRRKLKQCAHLCDRIQQHFADISGEYSDNPMYILDTLIEIGSIVESVHKLILNLRENM